ncbi:MAG: demethoxyubiquinone hydroxylase family protein [Alphaproteobacteria bacterium]|nr:demethoxyubiquinone hydroxylase family protein [Alphaproteobacteria bacterium]
MTASEENAPTACGAIEPIGQPTVFYDGACPLCAREIAFYRARAGADGVSWVDVSRSDDREVAPGLTKDQAMARFHVLDADGRLVSGGTAFARLWEALPGFRPFGRLFRVRPLAWVLDHAYDVFLRFRPRLQAMARRQDAGASADYPAWLVRELRSNHAGETGAVAIYSGILAISRDPKVRRFAEAHLQTEQGHLELIETLLPRRSRSAFLPLWRIAGFITGALPALFGRNAVFATIDAVETFVDHHYAAQIARLTEEGIHENLRATLERCRQDEVDHRDEARHAMTRPAGPVMKAWRWMIGAGSAAAVALARRF